MTIDKRIVVTVKADDLVYLPASHAIKYSGEGWIEYCVRLLRLFREANGFYRESEMQIHVSMVDVDKIYQEIGHVMPEITSLLKYKKFKFHGIDFIIDLPEIMED